MTSMKINGSWRLPLETYLPLDAGPAQVWLGPMIVLRTICKARRNFMLILAKS